MQPTVVSSDAQDYTSDATVGQGSYVIRPGDCLISLSEKSGLLWKTIWEHPENAELRQKRGDPRVLLPGDRVVIPEKRLKHEPGATEARHRFVRNGVPAKLRLEFHEEDQPLANEPYLIIIDGKSQRGTTDAQGRVEIFLPKQARRGTVHIGQGDGERIYDLNLGTLDPFDSVSGVQARLNNLGFEAGPVDGRLGPQTTEAIRKFQAYHDLEVTGVPDRATCHKLKEQHSS
jgi:hypothetical protein